MVITKHPVICTCQPCARSLAVKRVFRFSQHLSDAVGLPTDRVMAEETKRIGKTCRSPNFTS